MSRLDAARVRTVLYEGPGAAPVDPAVRSQILSALLEKGLAVTAVRSDIHLTAADSDVVVVMGHFLNGAPPVERQGGGTVRFQTLDGLDAPGLLTAIEGIVADQGAAKAGAWKPWFPVIDYNRCTNCMQCLSFCLFDVYGVSQDRKIEVRNQDNCKTECPACSRVCPEVAIMFPKYRHAPINGDQVSTDDMRREAMKVDISALLGGDVYALLRDRSVKATSRFSKERDDERALKERQNCLRKLQQDMDIPAEVLSSLPSLEEIRAKSERAAAQARAALEHQEAK